MKYFFGLFLTLTTLSGCATYNAQTNGYSDRMENFNRVMFNFNYYFLDPYIAKPAAIFWRDYIPKPVRSGFVNISSNITEPASMVNSLLEGDGKKATVHFTRFFLNTVFGFAGLIDLASMADPMLRKQPNREFGNVLGHYGVNYGPFVVLPFYGPATLRDDGGQLIDYLYMPLSLLTAKINVIRWIFNSLETRSQLLDIDHLLKGSNDPYQFIRQAYFQRHDFLAQDGKPDIKHEQERFKTISDHLDEIDKQ